MRGSIGDKVRLLHILDGIREIEGYILRNAIREGMESGRASDFDPKAYLEKLKSGKKNNG